MWSVHLFFSCTHLTSCSWYHHHRCLQNLVLQMNHLTQHWKTAMSYDCHYLLTKQISDAGRGFWCGMAFHWWELNVGCRLLSLLLFWIALNINQVGSLSIPYLLLCRCHQRFSFLEDGGSDMISLFFSAGPDNLQNQILKTMMMPRPSGHNWRRDEQIPFTLN